MKPRLRKDVKVLVVDVSSSHVKCVASGQTNPFKLKSGPNGAKNSEVHQGLEFRCGFDWLSRRSSLRQDCPRTAQSGFGLVCFDFQSAFGRSVKAFNDGAMQLLGGYEGGKMLFLGLGTGLGSALIGRWCYCAN
jgi:polyphosphate glucokinase